MYIFREQSEVWHLLVAASNLAACGARGPVSGTTYGVDVTCGVCRARYVAWVLGGACVRCGESGSEKGPGHLSAVCGACRRDLFVE